MHAIVPMTAARADGDLVRRLSVPDQAFCRRRLFGRQFQGAIRRTLARVTVEIVKRSDQAKDFVVLPKR